MGDETLPRVEGDQQGVMTRAHGLVPPHGNPFPPQKKITILSRLLILQNLHSNHEGTLLFPPNSAPHHSDLNE